MLGIPFISKFKKNAANGRGHIAVSLGSVGRSSDRNNI